MTVAIKGASWDVEVREQNLDEMFWMVDRIRGSRSVLEIGSRNGATLQVLACACQYGAKIRSIDIERYDELEAAISKLQEAGFDAERLTADSTSQEAIKWAQDNGPYDFVFIDGDHTYEGVKADWENYGPMGKCVGFHDIANLLLGVPALWAEIKKTYRTDEISAPTCDMGIGIVEKETV